MPGNPNLRKKEDKHIALTVESRGSIERREMEKKFATPTLWFVGDSLRTFFRLKETDSVKSFQVILPEEMSIPEIRSRMLKAFGENGNGFSE